MQACIQLTQLEMFVEEVVHTVQQFPHEVKATQTAERVWKELPLKIWQNC